MSKSMSDNNSRWFLLFACGPPKQSKADLSNERTLIHDIVIIIIIITTTTTTTTIIMTLFKFSPGVELGTTKNKFR